MGPSHDTIGGKNRLLSYRRVETLPLWKCIPSAVEPSAQSSKQITGAFNCLSPELPGHLSKRGVVAMLSREESQSAHLSRAWAQWETKHILNRGYKHFTLEMRQSHPDPHSQDWVGNSGSISIILSSARKEQQKERNKTAQCGGCNSCDVIKSLSFTLSEMRSFEGSEKKSDRSELNYKSISEAAVSGTL